MSPAVNPGGSCQASVVGLAGIAGIAPIGMPAVANIEFERDPDRLARPDRASASLTKSRLDVVGGYRRFPEAQRPPATRAEAPRSQHFSARMSPMLPN